MLSTPADRYPLDVQIADVSGDGKRDLVVANHVLHSVTVLRNTSTPGVPSFTPTTYPSSGGDPLGQNPTGIAVGDFDFDGRADLALSNFVSDNVSVLLGTGGGALAAAAHQAAGAGPMGLTSAYLDDNSDADLVVADFGRYPDISGNGEEPGTVGVLLAR